MRSFDIPVYFRSPIIARVKAARTAADPRRRDLSPTLLDFGPVRIRIARHFGFCFGVENAIEIAYRTLEEQKGRRVFLLSEMIHNPHVNDDLRSRGVGFIMTPGGEQLVAWDDLTAEDVVIVPAFGTTLAIQERLAERGIDPYRWDTTCPFVEKVWKRSGAIGEKGYTVVVHGRRNHEETRATVSHAAATSPVVVVQDMAEADRLAAAIVGELPLEEFLLEFADRVSPGFDPERDLGRIGVVNQTTMLASETQAIVERLKRAMIDRYGEENDHHFADTRDTLCYATNENQSATAALIESGGDLALVVGGYNSSNTSHLVELCEERLPTYFVRDAAEIESERLIHHFDLHRRERVPSVDWLPRPDGRPLELLLTSGASCPDPLVDEVIERIVGFFPGSRTSEEVTSELAVG